MIACVSPTSGFKSKLYKPDVKIVLGVHEFFDQLGSLAMGSSWQRRLPQMEVNPWQFIPPALCFDFVGKAKPFIAPSLLVALMGIGSIHREICDDTASVRIGIGWVD